MDRGFSSVPSDRLCKRVKPPPRTEDRPQLPSGAQLRAFATDPFTALRAYIALLKKWNRACEKVSAVFDRLKRFREAVSSSGCPPGQLMTSTPYVTRGPSTSWMTPTLVIHGGACA
ncbi:hypothetical protein GCM10029964_113370 [Kibdelosporangium lantanae]